MFQSRHGITSKQTTNKTKQKSLNLGMVSPVNRHLINKMFQSRHGITSKQTPNKQNVSI
jgi:hypothetical protein